MLFYINGLFLVYFEWRVYSVGYIEVENKSFIYATALILNILQYFKKYK